MPALHSRSPREPGRVRLDRTELNIGPGVALVPTSWDPKRHPARSTDRTVWPVIEFMSSGSFRLRSRRGCGVGDANTAILFDAEEEFSVDHPFPLANRGLSLRIAPDVLAAWWEPGAAALERGRTMEIGVSSAACVDAVALRRRALAPHTRDLVELGSCVIALLSNLTPPGRSRTHGHAGARARILEVRERLASSLDAPPTLDALARAVGCSPWHLAHEFKRWQGVTIHTYSRALRLRAVLARLGSEPIGDLAHRFGFASHSHLSAQFRREFGSTPSSTAAALAAPH